MSIKQRIRSIRAEQGISQEALAELLDVSRQTISKWENGQVRPLGVSVDALVKDDWIPLEPEVQIVEVPVSRSRNYRLWALLAAAVLVAGILVGALFFRKRPEVFVHSTELEGEVIDNSMIGGGITLLPP